MYRIRLHGRGGQGIKTAGRILGSAFFLSGFGVQDAPRYGAERRGAPIFAYVRAARGPIHERGIIVRPDLVVVVDDTLVPIPAAGVLVGLTSSTVLLLWSAEPPELWRQRLSHPGPVFVLSSGEAEAEAAAATASTACAGAAARLSGVIPAEALEEAVRGELEGFGQEAVRRGLEAAGGGYEQVAAGAGVVQEGPEVSFEAYSRPDWIELPLDETDLAGPAIHAAATSVQVRTGLWRTLRPVVHPSRCKRCWWVCGSFCPDGVISLDAEGYPKIDYDHCKGCMVCVAQCPSHAIEPVPERLAAAVAEEP